MNPHPVILNFILATLGLIKPYGVPRTSEENAIIRTISSMKPTEASAIALTLADIKRLPEYRP